MTDLTVTGAPELAVRDFGGTGRDLVLLHGFGGSLLNWSALAPLLTDRFHVLALDLRGHGHSGDGPWTWAALIGDLERVVAALDLRLPAVLGESLGGALAAHWAARHPECPGAINLDGLRAVETTMDNYPDIDPDLARRQLAELTATFRAQAKTMAAPLTDTALPADESLARNVTTRDGRRFLRPNAATVAAFRAQLTGDFDLIAVSAKAQCPLLVCAATRNLPGTGPFAELLDAQRRGVDRDLAAAAAANPRVRVERVDASHAMVREAPETLAALVLDFLG